MAVRAAFPTFTHRRWAGIEETSPFSVQGKQIAAECRDCVVDECPEEGLGIDALMDHRISGPRALFSSRTVQVGVDGAEVDSSQRDVDDPLQFRIAAGEPCPVSRTMHLDDLGSEELGEGAGER